MKIRRGFSFVKSDVGFGLDLSSSSIKVAQLARWPKGLAVRSVGQRHIRTGLIQQGRIIDQAALAREIRALIAKTDGEPINSPFVSVALPEEEAFIRVVEVDSSKSEDLEEAIKRESEANIPVYLNEVYLDWQEIQISQAKEVAPQKHFLIAAVRKEVVDSYVATLKLARLQPIMLEPESLSIARALMIKSADLSPKLIIDLGADRTTFIIYSGDSVRFTVPIKFEGDDLTGTIAEGLKVNKATAEKMKTKFGLDVSKNKGEILRVLQPRINYLIEQIERYIDFYNTHPAHEHASVNKISKVILSGGGAAMMGIEDYLTEALNLPVEVGNPWNNILKAPLPQLLAATQGQATHFTTALGLALGAVRAHAYD